MKAISSHQMSQLESLAYREGSSEMDFMEEAGSGIALVVHDYIENHNLVKNVTLVCGKGNNGGDAYVAGVHLLHLDCDVLAFQLVPIDDCSTLCRENYHRFIQEGGRVLQISDASELSLPSQGIIVDGIFGTGFQGVPREPYASIIKRLNESLLPIIAVDIPSGLNGTTGEVLGEAIVAVETAFLGLPKTGFFLNQGWNCVGALRYVDFGLPRVYIEEVESEMVMLESEGVRPYLPKIKNSRHKYEAGYVVGLAGSPSMPGAAILASTAALRGGAGIVRLLHPKGMETQLAGSLPELIKSAYDPGDIAFLAENMNKASATFIGPGLGRDTDTFKMLAQLLPLLTKPCVVDADALNMLAHMDVTLPPEVILTPHHGEMDRLLHNSGHSLISMDYLQQCQAFAQQKAATLVLKGGPSFIFHDGMPIAVNPRGDPGMATAGSGDVLTGLLAALLAQGLSTQHAAYLGVYIHAVAGEFAAGEYTPYCLIASDILYRFPEGFLLYERM